MARLKQFDAKFAPVNYDAASEDKKALNKRGLRDEFHAKVLAALASTSVSSERRAECLAFLEDWRDHQPAGYYEGSYTPKGLVMAAVVAVSIRERMRENERLKEEELEW